MKHRGNITGQHLPVCASGTSDRPMMSTRVTGVFFLPAALVVLCTAALCAESPVEAQKPDYLGIVSAYADALLEHGRDTYGEKQSPLFYAALERESLQPKKGFPGISGIRPQDRCTVGANPMHDENLYQILYALTQITGEKKYAEEADKALKFFFEHCQSPATGLMAWGEHIGWNFTTESVQGNTHEFFRPWVLWDLCYRLAPASVVAFAKGLWEHQIGNHETGNFSRHASWSKHGTEGNMQYPRHGGFYIMTWAKAYRETKDPVFAKATETLIDMYNQLSAKETGAIPCCTWPGRERIMWPESNLSLAVDLTDTAEAFPEPLQEKMLDRAAKTDKVYIALKHDFTPNGIGFVAGADIHTLATRTSGNWTHTEVWAAGYGHSTDAQIANLCYLRYRQIPDGQVRNAYRKLILDCASRYLNSTPDLEKPIYPGPMGDAIFHMLAAYEISKDRKYLERADVFAGIVARSFLSEGAALPRASSKHDHYEAITRGDTMMMGLLKLWQVQNRPDLNINLVYTDR